MFYIPLCAVMVIFIAVALYQVSKIKPGEDESKADRDL